MHLMIGGHPIRQWYQCPNQAKRLRAPLLAQTAVFWCKILSAMLGVVPHYYHSCIIAMRSVNSSLLNWLLVFGLGLCESKEYNINDKIQLAIFLQILFV